MTARPVKTQRQSVCERAFYKGIVAPRAPATNCRPLIIAMFAGKPEHIDLECWHQTRGNT